MNRYEIYELIGRERRGILVSNIIVDSWGEKLVLRCLYDPEERERFDIVFNNCLKFTWEKTGSDGNLEGDLEADLIFIFLGKSKYQENAIILTDLFAINLSYEELIIEKDW